MTPPDAFDDTCPRCGAPFRCGAHDAAPCACTTLQLDDALLMQLRVRYSGCLCLRCLSALAGGEAMEPGAPSPAGGAAKNGLTFEHHSIDSGPLRRRTV